MINSPDSGIVLLVLSIALNIPRKPDASAESAILLAALPLEVAAGRERASVVG